MIDIDDIIPQGNNFMRYDSNQIDSESIWTFEQQYNSAPPPYFTIAIGFCSYCGVARREFGANFCSSCGHPF